MGRFFESDLRPQRFLAVDRAVVGASAKVGRFEVGRSKGVPSGRAENFFRIHIVHVDGDAEEGCE